MRIGSARHDENGKLTGGRPGDQTGTEVSMQNFYVHKKGWYVLRPKTKDMADKLAESMITACNNDNIGYCQGHRLGIVKYGINLKGKQKQIAAQRYVHALFMQLEKMLEISPQQMKNLYFFLVACLMTLEVMRQEWFFTMEMFLSQKPKVIQRL